MGSFTIPSMQTVLDTHAGCLTRRWRWVGCIRIDMGMSSWAAAFRSQRSCAWACRVCLWALRDTAGKVASVLSWVSHQVMQTGFSFHQDRWKCHKDRSHILSCGIQISPLKPSLPSAPFNLGEVGVTALPPCSLTLHTCEFSCLWTFLKSTMQTFCKAQ